MKVLHVCTGCGAEKMLDPRKKHYHHCNPAPFVFIVKADKVLIGKIIKSFVNKNPP